MSLSINIELSDRDLEHFARGREKARQLAAGKSTAEIVQAAAVMLQQAEASEPPEFVRDRLDVLDSLIAMVRDDGVGMERTSGREQTEGGYGLKIIERLALRVSVSSAEGEGTEVRMAFPLGPPDGR